MPVRASVIRFDSVSLSRRGRAVYRDFSHEFRAFPLALLGPNGAGKSTLFALLSGAIRPHRGTIALDGADRGASSGARALRRRVGLVAQRSEGLRGLSVRELVAYAGWLRGLSRGAAWAASADVLDRLHLTELAQAASAKLSGGETRRMMIAMALVREPATLLLDEPTTGLDPAERRHVLDLVTELAEERPVVVATHEVDDIEERFAHLAVIDDGQIAFEGTVQDFLARAPGEGSARSRADSAYATILDQHRTR